MVWSDGLATPVNNVVITKSTDGGRSWSAPKAIDQAPVPHAFNQTVQVAGDGTVAVLYYDFRNNTPAPGCRPTSGSPSRPKAARPGTSST